MSGDEHVEAMQSQQAVALADAMVRTAKSLGDVVHLDGELRVVLIVGVDERTCVAGTGNVPPAQVLNVLMLSAQQVAKEHSLPFPWIRVGEG